MVCDQCEDSGTIGAISCSHCKEGAKIIVSRLFDEQKRIKLRLTENQQAIERIRRVWRV